MAAVAAATENTHTRHRVNGPTCQHACDRAGGDANAPPSIVHLADLGAVSSRPGFATTVGGAVKKARKDKVPHRASTFKGEAVDVHIATRTSLEPDRLTKLTGDCPFRLIIDLKGTIYRQEGMDGVAGLSGTAIVRALKWDHATNARYPSPKCEPLHLPRLHKEGGGALEEALHVAATNPAFNFPKGMRSVLLGPANAPYVAAAQKPMVWRSVDGGLLHPKTNYALATVLNA